MRYKVASVDPLIKIFKDTAMPMGGHVVHAVRGEVACAQIALQLEKDAMIGLINPIVLFSREAKLTGRMNFVGFVPVRKNTPDTPLEELVRKAPGLFPDPILEEEEIKVLARQTQPIWITIPIKLDQAPGIYRGAVKIGYDSGVIECEIQIVVHKARLPEKRNLKIANQFRLDELTGYYKVELWSKEMWQLVEGVAKDMASHRQNVIMTPLWDLLEFSETDNGLNINFEYFDKWIRLFDKYGVAEIIEGHQLGCREGDNWEAEHLVLWPIEIKRPGKSSRFIKGARAGSGEMNDFLKIFLPALHKHLVENGWASRYVQHIADEPTKTNVESWKIFTNIVRHFLPDIRIMEATMCSALENTIDIWIPLLHHFDKEKEFYKSCIEKGDEVWFYSCLVPRGPYPNRFIDFSLVKTRILHWINFKYGLTGYLHWGYNFWRKDPFLNVEPPQLSDPNPLPPGDSAIVYPGKAGVIPSIRWEMMRKGIEDYELLLKLKIERPDLAEDIIMRAVQDLLNYVRSPEDFNRTRFELINALDQSIKQA